VISGQWSVKALVPGAALVFTGHWSLNTDHFFSSVLGTWVKKYVDLIRNWGYINLFRGHLEPLGLLSCLGLRAQIRKSSIFGVRSSIYSG
jgi:hypothetical protein